MARNNQIEGAQAINQKRQVVIVGGGFGGLYAAQHLGTAEVQVTLVDRRNFHLFQPLLYQVATGGLSPADIASPLRSVLSRQKNTRVLQGEVVDIDVQNRRLILQDGELPYDTLVVAAGSGSHYFGHPEWAEAAPGLKSVEDALEIRRRVFQAFEAAERETDPEKRRALLTFVVVGGGPTGVELAGALGELAHHTLKSDFRSFQPSDARILLLEGGPRILPAFDEALAKRGVRSLERLGVEVRAGVQVRGVSGQEVTVRAGETEERIPARTILWAAGMKASPLGALLAERTGAELDRTGRVVVRPNLTLPGHPEIFVIGDLAHTAPEGKGPLPAVAPVAMQQGKFVAARIRGKAAAETPFRYWDKGSLAVVGRNAAVAAVGRWRLHGLVAWLLWAFIHILYLVEFDNRLLVLLQWAWNYWTYGRGARLITNDQISADEPTTDRGRTPAGAIRAGRTV